MEYFAYLLKQRLPSLFSFIEKVARVVVKVRYGSRITSAENDSLVEGSINDSTAQMRALRTNDVSDLKRFLDDLPLDWLRYFRPHSFETKTLIDVVNSRAFLIYGLFVDGCLQGYALLKITPTGCAFIGLLVHPDLSGRGLGRFIVEYLYWQASLAGLRTRSTISRLNLASLRSHEAVSKYKIVADLPNDFIMIEFPFEARFRPKLHTR